MNTPNMFRPEISGPDEIKDLVRTKYAEIALQDKASNAASCCGAGPRTWYGPETSGPNAIFSDDYSALKGYNPDADLGLGCGLPTQFAGINPGDTVLDLGSGAGNDCFVARHETGADGRVIGVDFTPEMIAKAKANAAKLGFQNVEFRQGDIEALPLTSNIVDVVVSNCVLNLVPDKRKAFSEVLRVLKPNGHFSISDVVLRGELPDQLQQAAEMYAGCVSGALHHPRPGIRAGHRAEAQADHHPRRHPLQLPERGGDRRLQGQWNRHLQHHGGGIQVECPFSDSVPARGRDESPE
jgi:SAM-dependent methyltransferase